MSTLYHITHITRYWIIFACFSWSILPLSLFFPNLVLPWFRFILPCCYVNWSKLETVGSNTPEVLFFRQCGIHEVWWQASGHMWACILYKEASNLRIGEEVGRFLLMLGHAAPCTKDIVSLFALQVDPKEWKARGKQNKLSIKNPVIWPSFCGRMTDSCTKHDQGY